MTLKLDRIIDWKVSKEKKPLTSNYFQVHIKVEIRAVKCYDKKEKGRLGMDNQDKTLRQ